MTGTGIDEKYYINVAKIMREKEMLPRPRLKRTILVTGWGEFLKIIPVECPV